MQDISENQETPYWTPTLSPKQLEAFNFKAEHEPCTMPPALLLAGPRETGKCVSGSTIVYCDGGLKRIRDIVGDLEPGQTKPIALSVDAMTASAGGIGKSSATIGYIDQTTEAIRFVSDGGFSITASPKHRIWCSLSGNTQYVKARDIISYMTAGVDIWIPIVIGCDFDSQKPVHVVKVISPHLRRQQFKSFKRAASAIQMTQSGSSGKAAMKRSGSSHRSMRQYLAGYYANPYYEISINESVAYLLGLICGDGCTSPTSFNCNRSIGFSTKDQALIDSINRILSENFPHCKITKKPSSDIDWTITGRIIGRLVEALDMVKLAHNKQIPDVIISSPKSVLIAFLRGLFDTDGHSAKRHGYIEFCTSSQQLSDDVHVALLACGIIARRKFRKNKSRGAWHTYITADAWKFYDIIGFGLERKQSGRNRLSQRQCVSYTKNYPPEITALVKDLYETRFERGAERNLQRRQLKGIAKAWWRHASGSNGLNPSKLTELVNYCRAPSDHPIHRLHLGGRVIWKKLKSAERESCPLYDIMVPGRHNFIGNGIICHNTIAACHRIMRHLWETDGARFAIIGKTIKNVKEAGVVRDFTEFIIPEWLRANLVSESGAVFAYTTKDTDGTYGPKIDGSTKTWYFRVRNYWGSESELLLYSLDHDADVEDKLKNTRFSGIYFPELDRFKDFRVFMVSFHQLRMLHLRPEQHLWIADTNPAEEGTDHFAYRIFYETERLITENPEDIELYRNIKVIEMDFSDNPWLSTARIAAIKALYRHDRDLWNRYVEGKWIKLVESGTFADVFSENVHVVGDASSQNESEWEQIIPEENTTELISGWDMGDVNHSIQILSRRLTKAADSPRDQEFAFDVLDELIFIKKKVSLEALTVEFMDRKEYWEQKLKELYGIATVNWHHWSDQSAWHYRAAIDAYDELVVRRVSGGQIVLRKSVIQLAHSVKKRVRMIRKLLFDNRLFISARCHQTIDMLKNMKDLSQDGIYKHPMDSLSYALAAEEPRLLEMQLVPQTKRVGHIINVSGS